MGDRLLTSQRFDGVETKQARRGAMVLVRFSVLFHGALAAATVRFVPPAG